MKLNDFNYTLPEKNIAQSFVEPRDNSKLMIISNDKIRHQKFFEIINYLHKDDVLIFNKTKVVPNKIIGKKNTGGTGIFIVEKRIKDKKKPIYQCRIRGSHPKVGNNYIFNNIEGKIIDEKNDGEFLIEFNEKIEKFLKINGKLPIPFYVKNKVNEKRYQTVFAKSGKSLAAPTAGLHFTKELIKKIKKKGIKLAYVNLEISFSTFLKVTEENIKNKRLHKESVSIDKKSSDIINNRKGRLILCGTTVCRTLESFANNKGKILAGKKRTDIFIYPGYKLNIKPDMLITNFHLPKSSLLMLVSAYIDKKILLDSYIIAIKKNYRFFSLGDAMLLIIDK